MAGSSQSIRAGRAYIELGVQDGISKGLNKAAAKLKAFGSSVTGLGVKMVALGTAAVAPFATAVKTFTDMGSEIVDASDRTGIAIEALSELKYAAEQSGAGLGDLEAGVRGMNRFLGEAASGGAEANQSLARLGLTVADLDKLSPDERFKLLAERLSQIQDPGARASLAMKVFGKSASNLMPLMKDGAAGIEALQEAARRLGLSMSGKDARAAEELGDRLSDLWSTVKMGVFQVGAALAPAMRDLVLRITGAAVAAGQWVKENREMVIAAAKVALGILAVGGALVAAGVLISGVGYALGGLAVAWGAVLLPIKLVVAAFGVVAGIAGAILSPIGLIAAALIAAAGGFLYFSGVGASVFKFVSEGARNLAKDFLGWIKGVLGSTSTIGEAFGVVWQDTQIGAKTAWEYIKQGWENLKNFASDVFDAMGDYMASAWIRSAAAAMTAITKILGAHKKLTRSIGDQMAYDKIKGNLANDKLQLEQVEKGISRANDSPESRQRAIDDYKKRIAEQEASLKYLDDMKAKEAGRVDGETQEKLDAIEKEKQAQLDAIDQIRGAEAEQDAKDRKTPKEQSDARIKAALDERKRLEEERKRVMAAGGGQSLLDKIDAAIAALTNPTAATLGALPNVPKMPDLESGLSDAMGKTEPRGGFNAMAWQGLQSSGRTAEAIKDNTKATAETVDKLLTHVKSASTGLTAV
jgi:hypothetical protein